MTCGNGASSDGAPLRVALNHTRLTESGGVEGYLRNLVRFLLEHGHEVDFFATRFELSIEHERLRLIHVPTVRLSRPLRVWSFARSSRRVMKREHERQSYDVVQGFARTYWHNLYRDGSGCWDDYVELYLGRVARRGLRRLYYRIHPIDALVRWIERQRFVVHRPRIVFANSRFVADQIAGRYGFPHDRLRVVYSGVDCERHHPSLREEGRRVLAELFGESVANSRQRRYLTLVGNDYERKGLGLVIDALSQLERERGETLPPYVLFVVGRDKRQADFERRAREAGLAGKARFLGSRRDVPAILAGADALLLPSYFDAFANTVPEALASGTPALVTGTGGAGEWIEEGRNGWLAERADAEAVAGALHKLFDVPDLASLREAARRTAEAHSWEHHFEELEAIYREVAGSPEGLW